MIILFTILLILTVARVAAGMGDSEQTSASGPCSSMDGPKTQQKENKNE
jgi:hypothetical protein